MNILVSACLLGLETRYDGKGKMHPALVALSEQHTLIPVCPEQLGGLPTPRPPCEIRDGRVFNQANEDRTDAFVHGAQQSKEICELTRCQAAVLKSRSPSCGRGQVYDGSFSGTLVEGNGVFAQMLQDEGIPVFTEEELDKLTAWLNPAELTNKYTSAVKQRRTSAVLVPNINKKTLQIYAISP